MLGVYQVFIPDTGRRLVPGRGVQEARVRGERRGPDQAGDARRESAGDHQGELLFRRAGRRGEGQVQDHPHHGRRAVVSRRPLGLAVRPGLLVVRRRFLMVSRLVALGHAPARWPGGGGVPKRLPKSWPRPSCRSGPMERSPSRSTPHWPRRPTRTRTSGTRSTAEITDQSRRTIVGTGTVLVARKPFTVYTWVDRGHYRAGDTIEAGIRAQTLDRKPVAGKGTLKLLKIAYDAERRPVETTRGELGPGSRRRGSGPTGHQGVGRGPVPAGGDDRRRQGPRDRGGLPAHDHRARIRRCELPIQ